MKVRDVIRILHEDGWVLVAMRGSHKQFKRPVKQGRVTVPGQPGDDLARGTLKSIF
ncbi:MAG: type II toxin-antitoxin system HicA family toxin [Gammaproteobacteria bacterium]